MAATATTSAVIRSLNADFVRKGIVIHSDDAAATGSPPLDPQIQRLVESLKSSCSTSGTTKDVGEIASAIQLWKERSLHHTLQTLDTSKDTNTNGSQMGNFQERHIQAIELHEKAGRDVKEAVLRVIQRIIDSMASQIDSFSVNLAEIIRALLKPELEYELEREKQITRRLIEDKQKLTQERDALVEANGTLQGRIVAIEEAPDGGGDAILCRKLRAKLQKFSQSHLEMQAKLTQMDKENEKWKYEMTQMKQEMDIQQKTLAITRAMHEKETKQLVELVHLKQDHFQQVRQATSSAVSAGASAGGIEIASYDPYSGHSIRYKSSPSPTKTKARQSPAAPVLAHLAPPLASPPRRTRSASASASTAASSPNAKKRAAMAPSSTPVYTGSNNRHADEGSLLELEIQKPPSSPSSPRGGVSRPFLASSRSIQSASP